MQERKSSNKRRWFVMAAATLTMAVVSGCVDYTKRRDTMTLSAGEAQAWNRAVHVADPWPPSSGNTSIDGDGQRVSRVVEAYRKGAGGAPPQREIAAESAARKAEPGTDAAE